MNKTSRHRALTGVGYEYHAMTLEEVAEEMGVSRQRVLQIELKALMKASAVLKRRGLRLADLLGDDRAGVSWQGD